jgi:imidazolonepropionase-like amidohydrolase
VRDLGSRGFADVAVRDAIAAGHIAGPRMLVAVRSLSATGGHGDKNELPFDIKVDRYSGIADGPDEIRRKVRENIKYGADWIKLLATGGVMSANTDPTMADYTEDEIRAAVDVAREKRRDVAVHAHGAEGIKRATRAGVRSIEHCSMLDDEAIRLIKEHGTFVVPNPYTNQYILERGAAAATSRARSRGITAGIRPQARGGDQGRAQGRLWHRQRRCNRTGSMRRLRFVDSGMTPLRRSARPRWKRRLLRMTGQIGTLKPGAYADIIAVQGDPLADVRTLEHPVWVMKGGSIAVGDPHR